MIYLTLFLTFLKIGAFTFGGGYAMLPFIEQEAIKRAWATERELLNFVAVSESTPGPFAINMATYLGIKNGGLFGAFCATLGVVLPSFIIILLVAAFYEKYKSNRIVSSCMTGLKPAVIGLIAAALLSVAATVFFPYGIRIGSVFTWAFWISLAIFLVSVYFALKKVNPIKIICLCAVLGIAAGYTFKIPV